MTKMEVNDKNLGWLTEETLEKLKDTKYSLYDVAVKLKEAFDYFKSEVDRVPNPHQKYVLECAMRANYKIYSELFNGK
jgi:hypothetical protein